MNIIATSEFWSLVFVIAGLYTALKILAARREINANNKKHQGNEQAKEDEAQRRRMVHEADAYNQAASMEPFCGEGKKTPVSVQERNAKAYEEVMGRWPEPIKLTPDQERRARSRAAVARAQEAARASKSSSAAEPEIFIPVISWNSSGSPASSGSSSSSSHFSGGGGSFDGGGSSSDWGGSSSSSSSSSDCSSSSSDSGSSSCSSSD